MTEHQMGRTPPMRWDRPSQQNTTTRVDHMPEDMNHTLLETDGLPAYTDPPYEPVQTMADLPVPPPMYPQHDMDATVVQSRSMSNWDAPQPNQALPDPFPEGTQQFGIRIDTKDGRTYISRPYELTKYQEMYDKLERWVGKYEEDSAFGVHLPEGLVFVVRENLGAVIFFSYDYIQRNVWRNR